MCKQQQREENGVLLGVELGDQVKNYAQFIPYLQEHYDLEKLGFVLVALHPEPAGAEQFAQWARFFAEHRICFAFLYTQQRGAPQGRESQLTPEIVQSLQRIGGNYYLGDMIGETGGDISWPAGSFASVPERKMPQNAENLYALRDEYMSRVARRVKLDRRLGVRQVLAVEATACQRYVLEAGVDIPCLEMMCGNPEALCAFTRGAARSCGRPLWGCHIAHDWYGGFRNDDPLKYKRLRLAYGYAYLAGAGLIYLEGGDSGIYSYGSSYPPEHPYCGEYRSAYSDFAEFIRQDRRPTQGPAVSVAFLSGHLDAYSAWGNTAAGWCASTVWNQFGDEAWGYGDAEHSWRILDEIGRPRPWHDVSGYGEADLSGAPAWGQYDCVPAEAPLSALCAYDTLIFAGWNTMTAELLEKLMAYVRQGGQLLIAAAHLNAAARRGGKPEIIRHEGLSEFLGCTLSEEGFRANNGVKFVQESLLRGVLYPASANLACDPICAGGFAEYAQVSLRGGRVAAFLHDRFDAPGKAEALRPALVENRYGDGCVCLFTQLDYPGALGAYPLYVQVVRSVFDASHRACPIRVVAGGKLAFSVYPAGEGQAAIYLLNTGFDLPVCARILWEGGEKLVNIEACALKRVDIALRP